jgi:hypothetical protein
VDGDGHVRIAGLGTAFALSTTPTVDVHRSFYGVAPELIDPHRWGLHDTGATMASDVFAFAGLAWEVRMEFMTSVDKPLNELGFMVRFFLDELRFRTRALLQGFIRC